MVHQAGSFNRSVLATEEPVSKIVSSKKASLIAYEGTTATWGGTGNSE